MPDSVDALGSIVTMYQNYALDVENMSKIFQDLYPTCCDLIFWC